MEHIELSVDYYGDAREGQCESSAIARDSEHGPDMYVPRACASAHDLSSSSLSSSSSSSNPYFYCLHVTRHHQV